VHIFNFFRRHFLTTGKRYASVLYAVEQTGWPVFFTAATTIAALLSFYFVPIRHVRWMGLASAAVVFVTYLLVMTVTPALLSFGESITDRHHKHPAPSTQHPVSSINHNAHLVRMGNWILSHSGLVIIVFFVLVLFFLGGITQIYVSMNYEETFGLKIPYIARLDYIGNTKIGAPYSYDLSLEFNEPNSVKDPELLKRFDVLSSEIQGFPLVKRVSSLLDVIKDMNQVTHSNDPAYYRIPDDEELVAQLLLLYEMSGGTEQEKWVDYDYTTLRLLAEVKEFNTGEIEEEFNILKQRVNELFPEARLNMAGTVVQFSVVQNYITKGEVVSTLIALVVIGLLMMIVLRSVKTGLIGMIPNLAPVVVVLGLMGYLSIPLDVVTMVVIPILLGLAVDDTIHFITHSKLEFQRTGNYRTAIQKTFQIVGKAIFTTSFIIIAAFSIYMVSIAVFFFHLSILFISGVISALLADYFITPILVDWTKPFGAENMKRA
jgi:predicted RND superfamily exporter protein